MKSDTFSDKQQNKIMSKKYRIDVTVSVCGDGVELDYVSLTKDELPSLKEELQEGSSCLDQNLLMGVHSNSTVIVNNNYENTETELVFSDRDDYFSFVREDEYPSEQKTKKYYYLDFKKSDDLTMTFKLQIEDDEEFNIEYLKPIIVIYDFDSLCDETGHIIVGFEYKEHKLDWCEDCYGMAWYCSSIDYVYGWSVTEEQYRLYKEELEYDGEEVNDDEYHGELDCVVVCQIDDEDEDVVFDEDGIDKVANCQYDLTIV